ncbi:MAG: site-2 protease family protein [Actinobacteria bacterium]|nr:site-2 protease family protein [Actinomycetota bacterium]
MGLIGVLAFVLALLFSIMVHEYGHYITAKRYGMQVTEFFLGFGKRIWSTQRGETEFGIKAIPAGGYCKISGMSVRDEMPAEIAHRAFYKARTREKLIVLGSGSVLHFILGFIFLFILFTGVGVVKSLPTIQEVLPCVPAKSECAPNDPISPAKKAGLQPGDEVIGINGERDLEWSEISSVLRASAGKPISLLILRDGTEVNVDLVAATRAVDGEERGFIGVINKYGLVRENPISAISSSAEATVQLFVGSTKALMSLPQQIPTLIRQTFLGEERSSYGLVGIVGVARATGETASSSNLTIGEKIATFLLIIASLNIFVGIFNLIPILPLDGGHIAVALYEGARRQIYRIRGRSEPGKVDIEKLTPITVTVLIALIFLTALLLIADILNPINFNL